MSVNYIDKSTGDLIRVAGQGKAEYGASTVRKGTFTGTDNGTGLINITVTFDNPMPDADYLVDITDVSSLENFWVSVAAKTKNGFSLYLRKSTGGSSITVNGIYTAFKLYTDTNYNNLLNNAVLTSDVTDEVTNGDMNPVTSNAVYDAITDLTPVDAVTNGDLSPVTSNAVYDAMNDVKTITPTPVIGGAAGTITWDSFDVKKLGKLVNITINGMRHTSDVSIPGTTMIATGLPRPALGRMYVAGINYGDDGSRASAYIDAGGNLGIDTGFLLATSAFYGSCSYISV